MDEPDCRFQPAAVEPAINEVTITAVGASIGVASALVLTFRTHEPPTARESFRIQPASAPDEHAALASLTGGVRVLSDPSETI